MNLEDYKRQFEVEKFTDDFKEVINATKKTFPAKGVWLKTVPLTLISIGLVLAFVSLIVGSLTSQGYGMNSVVVTPPNNTNLNYDAFSNIPFQIWALRAAPQTAQVAPLPGLITLTLPDPNTVPEGGLILVRNTSIAIYGGGIPPDEIWAAAAQVKVSYNSNIIDTLNPNTYVSYVSIKSPSTTRVWYRNALP